MMGPEYGAVVSQTTAITAAYHGAHAPAVVVAIASPQWVVGEATNAFVLVGVARAGLCTAGVAPRGAKEARAPGVVAAPCSDVAFDAAVLGPRFDGHKRPADALRPTERRRILRWVGVSNVCNNALHAGTRVGRGEVGGGSGRQEEREAEWLAR